MGDEAPTVKIRLFWWMNLGTGQRAQTIVVTAYVANALDDSTYLPLMTSLISDCRSWGFGNEDGGYEEDT
jgi:hypothetical protein